MAQSGILGVGQFLGERSAIGKDSPKGTSGGEPVVQECHAQRAEPSKFPAVREHGRVRLDIGPALGNFLLNGSGHRLQGRFRHLQMELQSQSLVSDGIGLVRAGLGAGQPDGPIGEVVGLPVPMEHGEGLGQTPKKGMGRGNYRTGSSKR